MLTVNTRVLMYNAAVCVALAGVLIGFGRSMLKSSSAQPCGERLSNSTVFRLERDGAALTGQDILARVGPDSIGVTENVEVMHPRDTSIPAAMQVELRSGPRSATDKAGMAFPWQPRSVQNQVGACLSYKMFFYGDLEFHNGGVLPGLLGVDQTGQTQDRFAANLAWRHDGQPGVNLVVTADGETQTQHSESKGGSFVRAGWIKIDQEVTLNVPGQANGILRVWVDGALAVEKTNVDYRSKAEVALSGVAGNVSYGAADSMAWAPSDTRIWISPLEISWQ